MPKKEPEQTITSFDFGSIYDDHSAVVYGVVLEVTERDAQLAEILMSQIFVELLLRKDDNDKTVFLSFKQIIKTVSTVAINHGYSIATILKSIGLSPDQQVLRNLANPHKL
ncbi:MAG: hypothetical protein ABIQ31_04075 [Ferruginibacter sp.]